jgi:hypothetical protein
MQTTMFLSTPERVISLDSNQFYYTAKQKKRKVSEGQDEEAKETLVTFCSRWVNGNGIVQIYLLRTHFHRYSKSLQDLVTPTANNVDTHDALFGAHDDDLIHGGLFVEFVYYTKIKRPESRLVWKANLR